MLCYITSPCKSSVPRELSVTSPLCGDAIKETVSSLVANIPTFKRKYHEWGLDNFMLVSRPSRMDVSQVTQNGIEFRQEPAKCLRVATKVGWIDVLQQHALIRKRHDITLLILHSQ